MNTVVLMMNAAGKEEESLREFIYGVLIFRNANFQYTRIQRVILLIFFFLYIFWQELGVYGKYVHVKLLLLFHVPVVKYHWTIFNTNITRIYEIQVYIICISNAF